MLSSPEVNGVEEEIDNKEMESEEVSLVFDLYYSVTAVFKFGPGS